MASVFEFGEGTGTILTVAGILVVIMVAFVIYLLIKRKRSVYTYQYGIKVE